MKHLATVLERMPVSAAVSAAVVILALTTFFNARPDVFRVGLAAVLIPQSAAQKSTAQSDTAQQSTEQNVAALAKPTATREQRFAARVGITYLTINLSVGTIDTQKLRRLPPQKLEVVDDETLWLARALYPETIRAEEMELVAWGILNRVKIHYSGKDTYKEVMLDPWQFSAFNKYAQLLHERGAPFQGGEMAECAHDCSRSQKSARRPPASRETRHLL